MDENTNPLIAPPPPEIPLCDPPLVLALAQVRFPTILSINDPTHIAGFQESIRGDFPEYSVGNTLGLQPAAGGVQIAVPPPLHFFKGKGGWAMSLCQDFLAVYTTTYQNRDEFVARFTSVAEALRSHLKPTRVNRLGVRFVDRIDREDEMRDLAKLVRADFLGPDVSHCASSAPTQIVSRSLLSASEGKIVAQWGFLAANEKFSDIDAVQALNRPCWILDLDMFTAEQMDNFDPDAVSQKTGKFVDRIYAIFRHVFSPEFIQRRGGNF